MHKGVILLVQASDRSDALSQVNEFMEKYGEGDVWDWFQIGGRWNNTLAPQELKRKWDEKANKLLNPDGKKQFISSKDVEDNQTELQKLWDDLGLKGKNPYCDHYKLANEGNEYDVVPLSECLETVKEWIRDLEEAAEEEFAELVKAREEVKQKKAKGEKVWDMSAYHASRYKDAIYNNFCFDSNVFDITTEAGEELPENIDGYFAVMVDMHN